MDAYEATKIVFQRIQTLDPQNASKIMGVLLIQDHGEKEMIRLAFGPESLVHSVILKAKKELNLASSNMPSTPPTPSSPSPFSRQNSSSSRMIGALNLPSPLSIANSSTFSDYDFQTPDDFNSPSTMNSAAPPFYAPGEVDLIDELYLQDQLSFLNDASPALGPKTSDFFYQDLASSPTYPPSWGAVNGLSPHRRSCSVSDICIGSDDLGGGFGWKPCLFYARGYCKNGTSCRFLHGGGGGMAADGGVPVGSPTSKLEMMEQCQELLLRSKSTQQQRLGTESQLLASTNFPYSPNKCINYLLQQQQQQLPPDSPRGLMMGDGMHKFGRGRGDFGLNPAGSRQIYLTFPADSTFKEEDVSNYFSNFGPVQDVRIPYQQKRMFGFVTFDFPETVKLILAKGNPHFVCDARVLVKPYKEKGKIPDKQHRKLERGGEFTGCGSPTGLDSRDPFDIQIGPRMFYNTQDMLWRRKLEEQADLQQAIELQNRRRLMGLQLLDVKHRNTPHHHRALSTPTFFNQNPPFPEPKQENSSTANQEKDLSDKDDNSPPNESSDSHESLDHNLPDSPFASPKAAGNYTTVFSTEVEKGGATNNNLITGGTSSLDMPPFKSCYFQVPRFASGHETIGM
ncbi:hypothetical protein ACS0TY_003216 [Phlomoides rotata]